MYSCAQLCTRQHKPKKSSKEDVIHRAKGRMDAFACDGWLHITLFVGSTEVFVKLKHKDDHAPYWSIEVPEDVKEYVKDNPKLKTAAVSHGLV
jgi:hypothetical protein